MKHLVILGALLLSTQVGAQASASSNTCTPPDCTTGADKVGITEKAATFTGNASSTLMEDITVSIPAIVAMHLSETSWNVNLANLEDQSNDCECYRAGEHNVETGRDEMYDLVGLMKANGTVWTGDGSVRSGNAYSFAGDLKLDTSFGSGLFSKIKRAPRYPGIEYGNNASNVVWKGPIVCINRKVVQKFSNAKNGWTVNISLQGKGNAPITPGFPTFILGDRVAKEGANTNTANPKFVETLYNAKDGMKKTLSFNRSQALGAAAGTTGGWLDDYILEALVFDGYETAGVKEAAVKFELVGQF